MNNVGRFVTRTLVSGALAFIPVYLAALLLVKAMRSLAVFVKPFAMLLPEWLPAERLLSLVLVVVLLFLLGLAVRSPAGRATWERIANALFRKLPGYALFRNLTQRLAGESQGQEWKPVLAEIEDALVPGFIVEELGDGRLTVFVPSVPTPFAGAIYVLTPERVHALNVPFTRAINVISRWGSGCKDLVAAMQGESNEEVLVARER